jgi:trk system potassium uptake protein
MILRPVRFLLKNFSRFRRQVRNQATYEVKDSLAHTSAFILRICHVAIPLLTLVCFVLLIYDVGFNNFYSNSLALYKLWRWMLFVLEGLFLLRFLIEFIDLKRWRSRLFNLLMVVLVHYLNINIVKVIALVPSAETEGYFTAKLFLYLGTIFLFLTEASTLVRFVYRRSVNPAFLFLNSFLLLIVGGALLLLLPKATTHGISPIDALFTSASAVCVTGLIVVDTATAFTTVGKVIILFLIQIGGLGIMTFAGLLGYLAAGNVSFSNQFALKDMLSSNRMGNVLELVVRVIMVTFFFEMVGGILILYSLNDDLFKTAGEKLFFAAFHTVSAFCNAGFSTLSNGLYEAPVRFNYSLHLIIAGLVILGGMGFPIVFNLFTFIRIKSQNTLNKFLRIPQKETFTHILHASSRLALATSVILLALGFISYLLLEQQATLAEHPSWWGKVVTSIFASVTPRTAGFNTVNTALLSLPMVMIYLLLMWIGASPGSTGGGIKTTVAAVAFLNMKNIVLGKPGTVIFKTQISDASIKRAFAIILLSVFMLGITTLILSTQQPNHSLLQIAFESFSAFSTVGLSLGITAELTAISKLVLSIVMLIGRVGTLTMLVAFITPAKPTYHRFPTEDVLL